VEEAGGEKEHLARRHLRHGRRGQTRAPLDSSFDILHTEQTGEGHGNGFAARGHATSQLAIAATAAAAPAGASSGSSRQKFTGS
jgi:hypothetical protein